MAYCLQAAKPALANGLRPDELGRSVRAPTLIVLGDQDIVKLEHALELTRLISGARLLILPGGHGDYLGEAVTTQNVSCCTGLFLPSIATSGRSFSLCAGTTPASREWPPSTACAKCGPTRPRPAIAR